MTHPEQSGTPSATVRLTTAQALIRFLSAQHTERDGRRQRLVDSVWGIFGHGNVAGIGQALVEYRERMPYHQGRNEQAMVHAAVGFARHSGRLRVQAVTTSIGPGATNLVTGAALATINRLPVLLLPGDVFATRPADPVLQQLEHPLAADVSVNDTLRPVSRYFDRITRPERLVPAALEAMRVLTDPAETGAVTLALPQDVQAEAYDWPVRFFAERVWHVRRPVPDGEAVAEAARLIGGARRPLLIAGGGVHHSAAHRELADFARLTGIPVAFTQAGMGALPHGHPAEVGAIGHTGTPLAAELARDADVVIGVGTRYSDFTTASGTLFPASGARFVNLNIASFDAHKQSALALTGDARAGLRALTTELERSGAPARYGLDHQPAKDRWNAAVDAACAAPDEHERPTQGQLIGALQEAVGDRDVLINAAGSLPGDLHKLWRPRSAGQYHLEYGYSCMGYEIPAAIGVRLAAPDARETQVWALVGDGTYLMMPTELVTAVQEGLKIIVVLVQNHGYASIGGLSEATGGERLGTAYRFRAPDGTFTGDPLPVDLAANAASLGLAVHRAATVGELRTALAAARAADRACCVHVETAPGGEVPPAAAWWDVPVAEVATRPAARTAAEQYRQQRAAQHRQL